MATAGLPQAHGDAVAFVVAESVEAAEAAAELIEVVTVRLTLDRSEEDAAAQKKPGRRRASPKKTDE